MLCRTLETANDLWPYQNQYRPSRKTVCLFTLPSTRLRTWRGLCIKEQLQTFTEYCSLTSIHCAVPVSSNLMVRCRRGRFQVLRKPTAKIKTKGYSGTILYCFCFFSHKVFSLFHFRTLFLVSASRFSSTFHGLNT